MAALMFFQVRQRRQLRRNRIFRDRKNPFDLYDDLELFRKFRFRRQHILELTNEVESEIRLENRGFTLTPLQQVLVTLRYLATSSFQDVCGELVGVDQSTVSRAVSRVTNALFLRSRQYITFPDQATANRTKRTIFQNYGFPNVVGCIDGTQVRIQRPQDQEHEFVNRKGYHSINVQVICDADLVFINCVAKWPGSVHDSRTLRESPLFHAFENNPKPVDGIILGDSGYMQRDWLFTPLAHPATRAERNYNRSHMSARATVERSIGVLKRRWHCLRRLRLHPHKACKVIVVCVMLHNRARRLRLDVPEDSDSDSDSSSSDSTNSDSEAEQQRPAPRQMTERARVASGKAARQRLINNVF